MIALHLYQIKLCVYWPWDLFCKSIYKKLFEYKNNVRFYFFTDLSIFVLLFLRASVKSFCQYRLQFIFLKTVFYLKENTGVEKYNLKFFKIRNYLIHLFSDNVLILKKIVAFLYNFKGAYYSYVCICIISLGV